MIKALRLLPLAGLLLLAACSGDRVVLLPDPNGHVGRVEVTSTAGQQVLTEASAGTEVGSRTSAPSAPKAVSADDIQQTWGKAMAAMPPQPTTFLLYFKSGTSELTDESRAEFPRIVAEVTNRPHARLIVVGHADTLGSDQINQTISRERAEEVMKMLTAAGAKPEGVEVASHGKRNPLVKTADGVSEPRNRRVSVTVQ
ncbi:OmpA family protein [Insolitispirillum peregrinum]|uniref:OmpA family protein n=1 Tax=Insolitispirillum peregrinum TaxID=80876 RepID=UPI00361DFA51